MSLRKYLKGLILGLIFFGAVFILNLSHVHCEEKKNIKEISGSMETASRTNRLIHEKSPYLLQHAYNPVDWYPWGEEAFQKARKEDKPIFLSVGYSTCHWCHVMEKESFENPEIAKVMNEHFISIKLDREERPDVDNIYMTAVQAITGGGGWPMSVFLTADLKPFYGGTYFPPEDRWGVPGFRTVLKTIADKWKNDRPRLLQSAEGLSRAIQSESAKDGERKVLDQQILEKAFLQFVSQFDSENGGFGNAPKFPRSHTLLFLLRYWKRTGNTKALEMVEKTLQEMTKGGMYDHLGGGFHRYSVDGQWRVPHFEKMLYDQAILSKSYLEAYQATGKKDYADIAKDIFEYVLRDLTPPPAAPSKTGPTSSDQPGRPSAGGGMTDPQGAFYSAEDADSAADPRHPEEKSEGAFYMWTEKEIVSLLGETKAQVFNHYFGVQSDGNALSDPLGEFSGMNILYAAHSVRETAQRFGKTPDEIETILKESRSILFKARSKRLRPHLDDKALTDWNALMISSLAFGSRVLNEPRYLHAAKEAADFILEKMKSENGRLMHRYRDEEVAIPGFLEDYAFFTHGLFDLYEATYDPRYLEEARFLTKEMVRLFWDETRGGFFFTGNDAEKLIARTKEIYDGAIPSGNSVACLSLLRVGRLTMNREMENWASRTLDTFSDELARFPSGYPQMLIALDFALGPSREIVVAGDPEASQTQEMIREIYSHFIPNKVVALHPADQALSQKIVSLVPFMMEQKSIDGKSTAYVCKNYVCQLPATDIQQLRKLLSD